MKKPNSPLSVHQGGESVLFVKRTCDIEKERRMRNENKPLDLFIHQEDNCTSESGEEELDLKGLKSECTENVEVGDIISN